MKHILIVLSICVFASAAYGTKQQPEYIIHKGQKFLLANVPLERFFDANHPKPKELRQTQTNCWRGYIGTWEIKDKQLYLKSISKSIKGNIPDEALFLLVFKQKPPIRAKWYTGALRIPLGEVLRKDRMIIYSTHKDEYLHAGFQRAGVFWIYEKDIYFRVEKGNIISEHHVNNKGKGATQSIRDWGWILSTSIPIKEDFKWLDLRYVLSENFSKHKKSGKPFKTRAILGTNEESENVIFWIPVTPATDLAWIKCKSRPPRDFHIKKGNHLEIKAYFEKENDGHSLHVESLRPLKPGETIHHPEFKPPQKQPEKSNQNS